MANSNLFNRGAKSVPGDADILYIADSTGATPDGYIHIASMLSSFRHNVGIFIPVTVIARIDLPTLSGLSETIDGVNINAPGVRIFASNQDTPTENGIWVSNAGAWTRPIDWGMGIDVGSNIFVVQDGTINENTLWVVDQAIGSALLGVDNITVVEISELETVFPGLVYAKNDVGALSGLAKTIDGVDIDSAGLRVFVTNQTDPLLNGMWVSNFGDWERPRDWQINLDVGSRIFVIESGDEFSDTLWLVENNIGSSVVGTDSITVNKISPTDVLNVGSGADLVKSSTEIRGILGTEGITAVVNSDNVDLVECRG